MAVHPRWRGEHRYCDLFPGVPFGSSPLARGTRDFAKLRGSHYRFIPAGAGNTSVAACPVVVGAVHPRWRGEHSPPVPCAV